MVKQIEHPWARMDGNASPYLHLLRDRDGEPNYEFRAEADGEAVEIWIYDVIDEWFGVAPTQVRDDLKAAGAVKQINVHINSPGGFVFDGHAIYNLLAQHPAQVTVYIDGLAASAASVIAMAGDKIVMPENGTIMIHEAWGIVIGPAEDMEAEAKLIRKLNTQIAGIYAARTGNSPEKIAEMMAAETWLMGREAEEAGFADETIPAKKVAALTGRELLSHYRHTPEAMVATEETPTEPGKAPAAFEEPDMTAEQVKDKGAVAEAAPAAAPPQADPKAELRRYMAAFGADGATWFAEGLNWEDSQAKFNAAQCDKMSALEAENAQLKTRCDAAKAAVGTGPVSANDGESRKVPGQGAFEQSVKIRGR